MNDLQPRVANL